MSGKYKASSACKHWIGTVPVDSENAKFWENPVTLDHFDYIKLQEEQGHGENAYRHYQVYICLKEKKRLTWLKNMYTQQLIGKEKEEL